uniref:ABC transmembrane type-1 domain-containing protein n=1 Tax=Caenorhabditis tropicalis TaxID=1561998 RepID=A0A1I7T4R1_9PELO
MKAYESAGSTAEEVVSGIKIVQTFNGEQKEIDRYSTCLSEGMYWGIRRAFVSTFFSAFMSFATFSSMALAFWYGTSMVIDGLITPGTTFAVFWAVSGSMVCLNHASPQISVITTCRSAAAPIFKIIDRIVPFDGTSDDGITLSNVKGSVKFENVSFKYPTRPEVNVLENVNLYANQGENIAIVGHSGCGKSTLAALLMHFYEINDGKISVDGINIEELNLSHLRNLVGIVSQEPSLFVDTDGEYFDHWEHATGRIITRLATDAPNIRAAIDQRLADVLQGASAILCGAVVAFYYGPTMAPIGIATVALLISIQATITHILKKRGVIDAKNAEDSSRLAIEAVEEYRTVQYLTKEKYFVKKFDDGMESIHSRNLQRGVLQAFSYALTASYTYFNFAIGYRYGIYLISSNAATPFIIFQVIEAVNSASSSILAFGTYLPEYVRARVSAGLLFQMLKDKPKINSSCDNQKKIELNGDISLNNIHFKYQVSGRHFVLKDFTLRIKRGKTTALVGASGCGKSTIIQLLERFYDPLDGEITYDKNLLKDLNLKHLRSQIALVGQQPVLFNYSIRENIGYGLETINEATSALDVESEKVKPRFF